MPRTSKNSQQPRKSVTFEGSVDKIIQRRTPAAGRRESDHRLSELYQELAKTAVETRNHPPLSNCKVVYVSEVDRMRMARDSFKQYADDYCGKVMADLEAQRQHKLNEVQKLENIVNLSKEVLDNLKSIRQHTETVVEQTISRCRSLCQQVGQPLKRVEDLSVMEKSISSIAQDLQL